MNKRVVMNDHTIEWADSVRHLGGFVDATLSDSLISKFGNLRPKVLPNLFNTYCCSFYGSSIWGLYSNGFNPCVTAWNIGVRNILGLP